MFEPFSHIIRHVNPIADPPSKSDFTHQDSGTYNCSASVAINASFSSK